MEITELSDPFPLTLVEGEFKPKFLIFRILEGVVEETPSDYNTSGKKTL